MRKEILVACAVLALSYMLSVSQPATHHYSFQEYQISYHKTYSDLQKAYRKLIFERNLNAIQQHNSDPHRTYDQGVNQFTDLTPAEFAQIYLSPIMSDRPSSSIISAEESSVPSRVGVQIDWVAAGKVRPVVDEGSQCGASWAFSATGAMESAFMISGVKDIQLSAQELIDCSGSYGNYGCNGGFMSSAFKYVTQKGINQEKKYPYVGKNQKCTAPTESKWKIKSYQGDSKGCDFLLNAISKGPVSVAVDASNFYSYKEGILTKCGNSASSGALLVAVTDTYWKIQMSFGTKFGDNGFVRIGRGNLCAICDYVSYPQV